MSSTTRAQGGAGQALAGNPFAWTAPAGTEGGEGKEAWGSPASLWDQGVCAPWPGLLSSSCSSLTAQVGTDFRDPDRKAHV